MSKYSSALAEAASDIANSGFAASEYGTVEYGTGWNGLVWVSLDVLHNLDVDEELVTEVLKDFPEIRTGEALVWIREDSQGFVTVENCTMLDVDRLREDFDKAADEDE